MAEYSFTRQVAEAQSRVLGKRPRNVSHMGRPVIFDGNRYGVYTFEGLGNGQVSRAIREALRWVSSIKNPTRRARLAPLAFQARGLYLRDET